MFESLYESRPESFDRVARTDAERALFDLPADPDAGIPAGLDEMEPGPFLAMVLSTIDPTTVSGFARVKVLKARERLVSHHNAALERRKRSPTSTQSLKPSLVTRGGASTNSAPTSP